MDNYWADNSGSFQVTINRQARNLTLLVQRNMSCLDGSTVGTLYISGTQIARTLELPWRNDEEDISRIQAGTYLGSIRTDGTRGWRIELHNVPNHRYVQIHIGNYPRDTIGCILVGTHAVRGTDQRNTEAPSRRNARSAGISGDITCKVMDSAVALSKIREAMQAFSESGVSSQQLNLTLEVKD